MLGYKGISVNAALKRRYLSVGRCLTATCLLATVAAVSRPARAQTDTAQTGANFTVNSVADTNDGTCGTTNCTLREAINAANSNADLSTISFNIAGTGTQTLTLASALPAMIYPTVVNGYSQAGASPNTSTSGFNAVLPIVINGSNVGSGMRGLTFGASGSSAQGLKIQGFSGVVPAGQPNAGAPAAGIAMLTAAGLTTPMSGGNVQGCWLVGNTIGVLLGDVNTTTVGGTTASARNLIQANNEGVAVTRVNLVTSGNILKGNLFGTDTTGAGSSATTGNGGAIYIDGAQSTVIGGTGTGEANVIMNSVGDGIRVGNSVTATGGTGTTFSDNTLISGNSIYNNGRLGINLAPPGESNSSGTDEVSPNDAGDADTGPDGLQNFPFINGASGNTITGAMNSTPSTTFRLEFFSSPVADPSGYGEGKTYLGFQNVTTSSNGSIAFAFSAPASLTPNQVVTATATGPNGTSEFCAAYVVSSSVATSGVIISEFRLRGATNQNDEYVELYNTTNGPLNVSGWKLIYLADSGGSSLTIATGVTIPPLGHLLIAGVGYSLSSTAAKDISMSDTISDYSALTLYSADGNTQSFVSPDNTPIVNGQYAFVRRADPVTSLPMMTAPTANAASVFDFVATNGSSNGATYEGTNGNLTATLGTPGPQNLNSPTALLSLKVTLLDPGANQSATPNRARNMAATGTNATNGTLSIRRLVSNNTGAPITRLRFRIVNLTTLNSSGYITSTQCDLRALASGFTTQSIATTGGNVTVYGTTPDTTIAQSFGGGINSSTVETSSGVVTLSTPLAAGDTRAYDFTFGVVRPGNFTILLLFEGTNGTSGGTSVTNAARPTAPLQRIPS